MIGRTLGFYFLSLLPVTYEHLQDGDLPSEWLDILLSTALLTVVFVLGGLVAQTLIPGPPREFLPEVAIGATSAAVLWLILYVFWSLVPSEWAQSLGPAVFVFHLLSMFLAGMASAMVFRRRESKTPDHPST